MTDEISGGWYRPEDALRPAGPVSRRRPWPVCPRRSSGGAGGLGSVMLAVLALLFGYVLTHRPSPLPAPTGASSAASDRPSASVAMPWLGGRRGTGPAGLRLLVAGADPRVVDAATGVARPPPGIRLPAGAGVTAVPVGRSTIAVVGYAWGAGIFLQLPGADPLVLGGRSAVTPSLDGQLIVVASRSGRTIVSGLAVDRGVRWEWQSSDAITVLRDTPFGLVLQRSGRSVGGELVLVDRESGAVRRMLGRDRSVVAAGDRAAAWVPADCAKLCSLAVSKLRGGGRRDYPMPYGRMPESGAFSPDGRWLALTFPAFGVGPVIRPGYVGVLDLRTGGVLPVPQVRTAPELGADVTWSTDGRWMIIAVKWPDHQTIAFWRPGGELRVLATNLPGRPGPVTVLP
ncbi:MAG: hypothetical protein ACJ768_24090 [Gaiellaceae bacterium]